MVPFRVADIATVVVIATFEWVTLNVTTLLPDATVTEAGTLAVELELAITNIKPPTGAFPVSVTVPVTATVPLPFTVAGDRVKVASVGAKTLNEPNVVELPNEAEQFTTES